MSPTLEQLLMKERRGQRVVGEGNLTRRFYRDFTQLYVIIREIERLFD